MRTKHWLIADTHFGHNRLVELGHRPKNFENKIIDNLSVISENDILYHLGDFAFYKLEYWHNIFFTKCKAKRNIFIIGNHDRQTVSWYYSRGWDCVCNELMLNIFGKNIIFSHEPLTLIDLAQYDDETINVHGHVHNTNHRKAQLHPTKQKAVIMEHNYKPILLQELIDK